MEQNPEMKGQIIAVKYSLIMPPQCTYTQMLDCACTKPTCVHMSLCKYVYHVSIQCDGKHLPGQVKGNPEHVSLHLCLAQVSTHHLQQLPHHWGGPITPLFHYLPQSLSVVPSTTTVRVCVQAQVRVTAHNPKTLPYILQPRFKFIQYCMTCQCNGNFIFVFRAAKNH